MNKGSPFSPDRLRVLKRNDNDNIVLQIRMVNTSDKVISKAVIEAVCRPSGEIIRHTYSDLNAGKGENFGTKVPFETGMTGISDVDIFAAEACFSDGTVWNRDTAQSESAADKPEIESVRQQADGTAPENVMPDNSVPENVKPDNNANPYSGMNNGGVYPVMTSPPDNKTDRNKKLVPVIIGAASAAVIAVLVIVFAVIPKKNDTSDISAGTAAAQNSSAVTEAADEAGGSSAAAQDTGAAAASSGEPDSFIPYYSDQLDFEDNTYIGFYDGCLYYSHVEKNNGYIENTAGHEECYYCDVAIRRVNIRTGKCENLIKTCAVCCEDSHGNIYYDRCALSSDGKLFFTYEDRNPIEAGFFDGTWDLFCYSYLVGFDLNTDEMMEIGFDDRLSYPECFGNCLSVFFHDEQKSYLFNTKTGSAYDYSDYWISFYDGKYVVLHDNDNSGILIYNSDNDVKKQFPLLYYYNVSDRGDYVYLSGYSDEPYVIDFKNGTYQEYLPYDAVDNFLPDGSEYIGEAKGKTYYKKDDIICATSDYKNSDFEKDRFFNISDIIDHEKRVYSGQFDDNSSSSDVYYFTKLHDDWIIIYLYKYRVFDDYYFLDLASGTCYNVPDASPSGSLKNAASYIDRVETKPQTQTQKQTESYYGYDLTGHVSIESESLNIRNAPSTDGKIVGKLANNAKVTILDIFGDWYYIHYLKDEYDIYGYVYYEFIEIDY